MHGQWRSIPKPIGYIYRRRSVAHLIFYRSPRSIWYCVPSGERCPAGYALVTLYREEELDLLARRSERAHKDEGQLALIVGEPGLGKSRLMEEFHARLGGTPHTWVEWSSSQLLQNTPLHAITEWGVQRFGLNAPAEQRLADLEDLFS